MNQNLHSLTLGQIAIFLTVVELESFTKAGAKLHMTQSAISKTIAKLERELDLVLFTRHYRELSVTDAAKELYSQWKPKIEQLSLAYENVYVSQHEDTSALRIGATNSTDLKLYFWDIINDFQNQNDTVSLEFISNSMGRLIEDLAAGKADLIFIPDFMKFRLERLQYSWIWAAQDNMQIILPKDHPLTKLDRPLQISDLQDMSIVVLADEEYPENSQYFQELFQAAGFSLKTDKKFKTPESIQEFYQLEDGYMITDSYFKFDELESSSVRVPLKGFKNGIICGWDPAKEMKIRDRFIRYLKKRSDLQNGK